MRQLPPERLDAEEIVKRVEELEVDIDGKRGRVKLRGNQSGVLIALAIIGVVILMLNLNMGCP